MSQTRKHPKALKHGLLEEVFDGIYLVTGTCAMKRPAPIKFSRNMVVIRQGQELTLVNTVRLNEEGLKQLESLGSVKHLIRIAGFHGMDDPFYKARYGAKVWSVDATYQSSFDEVAKPEDIYLQPDQIIDNQSTLPLHHARVISIESSPKEALILLEREGGILISGDSLQNWSDTDQYFNFLGKLMMKKGGYIQAYNVGPAWLKFAKPDRTDLKNLINLNFQHLLPAHGKPVIGEAKDKYRQSLLGL